MHFGIKIPQNICKYTVCMIIGNFHIVSYFVLFNLSLDCTQYLRITWWKKVFQIPQFLGRRQKKTCPEDSKEQRGVHHSRMEEVFNYQNSSHGWQSNHPIELEGKVLLGDTAQNSMVTLAEAKRSCVQMGEFHVRADFQKVKCHWGIPRIWTLWQSGQMEAAP